MRSDSYSLVGSTAPHGDDFVTPSMPPTKSRRARYLGALLALLAFGCLCIVAATFLTGRSAPVATTAAGPLRPAANATSPAPLPSKVSPAPSLPPSNLGFDQIFMLNLAQRTDRRQSMQDLADFLHLNLTVVPATDKDYVLAHPVPGAGGSLRPAQIACWQSHMHIYQMVVDNPSIHSALILEDDVDISYLIHDEAARLLDAARSHAWDMLYLGHCSGFEGKADKLLDADAHLYLAKYPVCTHGYAVSKAGAGKLLKELAKLNGPIDLTINSLKDQHKIDVLIASPPLIVQSHFDGDTSDINTDGNNGMTGGNLAYSGRKHLALMLKASKASNK
ncbi:hypothetical protein IWQ60_010162 [Tieghemiomyces parasiticus]|uniref:Glycosyl transferase family 25 domain-containing protein n=1 Tax=Tieghemiomyces parasiticus TaxID=78921 RepID=A0A9W7ZKL6_9FUNG|nr:hypothetical protein IWQ60_010162 [Tieghemiomyces parasiticus]